MATDPITWLYDLQHFGVKLGLDNIRSLLAVIEHPEQSYPCLLVGGTNGKGSVAAMLESMLRAHGLRTGLFTSPHLVRPNERIRIDGRDIPTPELQATLRRMRESIEDGIDRGAMTTHPSFFEVAAATALQAFRDAEIDVGLLEVGMGGRLDATNAVDAVMSVVVTVDYDHTEKLGGTLERIAAEKAAIAKQGRPFVSGVSQEEARKVLVRVCREKGADLVEVRDAARLLAGSGELFGIETATGAYRDLRCSLSGAHQRENARVAVVALEAAAGELGFELDPDAVRRGLAEARWPGRLQWIDGEPPLLLDGAHNPAGARALARHLRSLDRGRPVLVFNTMRKKAVEEILRPLAGQVDAVVITRPRVERAALPEELAAVARGMVTRVEIVPDSADALARARALARPAGYVLVAGSLYLVGEVLGLLEGTSVPGPVPL